jgi:hypothetical protein
MADYVRNRHNQSPLPLFLDVYFQEGWAVETETWQGVVQDFLDCADEGAIVGLIEDIDEWLDVDDWARFPQLPLEGPPFPAPHPHRLLLLSWLTPGIITVP